jgi:hypothetical protein
MVMLPTAGATPVIRTDFTDDDAWEAVRAAILAPSRDGELFVSHVGFVDDPGLAGQTPEGILALIPDAFAEIHSCLFIVDQTTISSPDWPVLVIYLNNDRKAWMFRTIADVLHTVEANLSVGNLDFYEFVDAADQNGVFRGFGGPSRAQLEAKLPSFVINPSKARRAVEHN